MWLAKPLNRLLGKVASYEQFRSNMKPQIFSDGLRASGSGLSQPGPNPLGQGVVLDGNNHGDCFLPKLAVALANNAVCRARRKKAGGFVYCLVSNAYACPFAERVDYNLLCCHPEKENIILRTEAKRHK